MDTADIMRIDWVLYELWRHSSLIPLPRLWHFNFLIVSGHWYGMWEINLTELLKADQCITSNSSRSATIYINEIAARYAISFLLATSRSSGRSLIQKGLCYSCIHSGSYMTMTDVRKFVWVTQRTVLVVNLIHIMHQRSLPTLWLLCWQINIVSILVGAQRAQLLLRATLAQCGMSIPTPCLHLFVLKCSVN